MQNNYQGPPEEFAMVVPVPVVLQKEQVKTLPRELFDKSTCSARRASSSTGSRTRAATEPPRRGGNRAATPTTGRRMPTARAEARARTT